MSTNTASQTHIPFNIALPVGDELRYVEQAIASGHLSGDGPFTKRCHALLEQATGAGRVLLTTSCTHALEMSSLLLNVGEGDEVIVPDFTFVTSINAFVLHGATPVFCDVRPDTLNLDETKLEALITTRTKAIVVVHYAGVACEMDEILAIAARHGVPVVEDNAHGLLGGYKGRPLGSFGALATQSFHETKNFACGEGGALVINDMAYAERAEILREKGTDRSRFFRGQVDKYGWVDKGSSYLPSDILAAYLCAQLEARDKIQQRRQAICERYAAELADWARALGATLPVTPAHCQSSWHMFYLLLPDLPTRSRLIQHLKARDITAVFHYLPLHASKYVAERGWATRPCPVTDDVSERLLRLPLYNTLTPETQSRVIAAALDFKG